MSLSTHNSITCYNGIIVVLISIKTAMDQLKSINIAMHLNNSEEYLDLTLLDGLQL